MIERFEVGKMYRYTGKTRREDWNYRGLMDFVLDGKPRKCIEIEGYYAANFNNVRHPDSRKAWHWKDGIENWVEVKEEYI